MNTPPTVRMLLTNQIHNGTPVHGILFEDLLLLPKHIRKEFENTSFFLPHRQFIQIHVLVCECVCVCVCVFLCAFVCVLFVGLVFSQQPIFWFICSGSKRAGSSEWTHTHTHTYTHWHTHTATPRLRPSPHFTSQRSELGCLHHILYKTLRQVLYQGTLAPL